MSMVERAPGAIVAILDVGSNTVKLSVYACFPEIGPVAMLHDADTVRIGFRVSETGAIAADRLERLIVTLQRFETSARAIGATRFTGVATQAFRVAENARAAIDTIHARTAWRIEVISPEEETRLTALGARRWLEPGVASIVADIGGASTEVVAIDTVGAITCARSVPVGSGSLFDRAIGTTPPPPGSIDGARDMALDALDQAGIGPTGQVSPTTLLLPGGSGHYLSLLLESVAPETPFAPPALAPLHAWLESQPASETMARIAVQMDRALVLPASLAVVEALVRFYRPRQLVAVPSGIRDGLADGICPASNGE